MFRTIKRKIATIAMRFSRFICGDDFDQVVKELIEAKAKVVAVKYVRYIFSQQRLRMCTNNDCVVLSPLRKYGRVYYCSSHYDDLVMEKELKDSRG